MKTFTSVSQGKELKEILPPECLLSADFIYGALSDKYPILWVGEPLLEDGATPCWTLAPLLRLLPIHIDCGDITLRRNMEQDENNFSIWYENTRDGITNELLYSSSNEPINACVDLINKFLYFKIDRLEHGLICKY